MMRRVVLVCILSMGLLTSPLVWAQNKVDPQIIAKDLLGDDFRRAKAAEDDLVIMPPEAALKAVLAARAGVSKAASRQRCDRVLNTLLEEVLRDATLSLSEAGYGSIIALGGGMGAQMSPRLAALTSGASDEAEALSPAEIQKRSGSARRVLLACGAPMTRALIHVPPLREFEVQRALYLIAKDITKQSLDTVNSLERKKALDWLRTLGRNVDLAEFVIGNGIRDKRAKVRAIFQEFRDEVLEASIKNLADKNYDRRILAEDQLFRLGALSSARIEKLVKESLAAKNTVLHNAAKNLQHRLRFSISRALFEKLGQVFEDYDSKTFRERREVCLEIERLGGVDGIRSLRSIMRREKSEKVRLLAALSLARLGDPVGIYRIQQEGLAAKLAIPKGDLIAIYIDQGIKYMNIRRFANAEKEFLRVLKLDSKNESALYNIACCYSLWGKVENALDYLEKAVKSGFDDLGHIENDPDLDFLRQTERYKRLIAALEQKKKLEGEK
ncbi:MAG: hypothetical protein P1V97_28720 [Planctomycetota bacterium]|nr:hypothetical protein [Planctomycetota bacterium]